MPPQRQPEIERKSAWLPSAQKRSGSSLRRLGIRLFWASLLTGLLLGFMSLLARPLQSTATQLLILPGQNDADPDVPRPLACQAADFAALQSTAATLRRTEQEPSRVTVAAPLRVRDELARLADQLDAGIDHPSDAIIAYVKADGLLSEGVPHLRWQFDPQWTRDTTLPVSDFLRMLSQRPCAVKLLVLDCGSVEYDLAQETLVNRFVMELQTQVDQVNDPTLWVLTSRSDFEASHYSRSLGRSVFAHVFSQALAGLADHDADGSLTVVEAYRFTNQYTAEWVEERTAGRLSQTPRLIHAGLIDWAHSPEIVALNRTWQPPADAPPSGPDPTAEPAPETAPATDGDPSPDQSADAQTASTTGTPTTRTASATRATGRDLPFIVRFLQPALASRGLSAGMPAGRFSAASRSAAQPPTKPRSTEPANSSGQAKTPPSDSESAADQSTPSSGDEETPAADNAAGATAGGTDDGHSEPRAAEPDDAATAIETPVTLENPAWSQLLEVWQARDALAQTAAPRTIAPYRFRLLEQRLRDRQPAVIFAAEAGGQAVAADLRRDWNGADGLPALEGVTSLTLRELALQWPAITAVPTGLPPAARQQLATAAGWQLSPDDLPALAQYEQRLAEPQREPLELWLSSGDSQAPYMTAEVGYARQLLRDPRFGWEEISGLLKLRLSAERAMASAAQLPGMLDDAVLAAERQRLGVERQLVFAPGPTPPRESRRLIAAATARCAQVQMLAERLLDARRLAIRMLSQVPAQIDDFRRQSASLVVSSVDFEELRQQLRTLAELLEVLNRPWSLTARAAQLEHLVAELERSERSMEAARQATIRSVAAAGSVSTWQEFRIQSLLQSVRLSAGERGRLLASLQNVVPEPRDVEPSVAQRPRTSAGRPLPLELIRQHAELELLRCRLMAIGHADVEDQYRELQQQFTAVNAGESDAVAWNSFAGRLHALHGRLRAEVEQTLVASGAALGGDSATLAVAPMQSLQLTVALCLLPVDDAQPLNLPVRPSLSDIRVQAVQQSLTQLQDNRLQLALQDAPRAEAETLRSRLADAKSGQPSDELEIQLPVVLPVRVGDSVRLPVSIYNPGATAIPVRVFTEVDERLIQIVGSPGIAITTAQRVRQLSRRRLAAHERELADLLRTDAMERRPENTARITELEQLVDRGAYPLSAAETLTSPTVTVPPGERRVVPLTIRCVRATLTSTWMTVRLETPAGVWRYDVPLDVPRQHPVQPQLIGVPGTVTERDDQISLNGFPNATTSFQTRLVSQQASDRLVQVELLALARPVANPPRYALSAEAAATWRQTYVADTLATIDAVTVPAGQSVPLTWTADGPAAASEDPAATDDPPGEPAAQPEPPPVGLDHGLLMCVTSPADQTVSLFPLTTTVQHPRRFLKVTARQAGDDARSLLVDVSAEPEDLPPEGMSLELGFRPVADTGTVVRPLTRARSSVRIQTRAPSTGGVLELSVNGHRRAFAWRLDAAAADGTLRVDESSLAVHIRNPAADTAYPAPTESVAVTLDVEAPPGFPRSADDQLVVGIDVNRDRDLIGEPTRQLAGTQSIGVWWRGLTDDGQFQLGSTVSPLVVHIPTAQLADRVNLLARLQTADRTAWSAAVPLCFDGSRPRLTGLGTVPAERVATGAPLQVAVRGSDGDSSGIATVIAGFVGDDPDTFLEAPPPTALKLAAAGQWLADVDTTGLPPGPATLVVQATDHAGNQSVFVRRPLQVITADEAARMAAEAVNDIRGTILYGGQPVAGCQISLRPPEPDPADPAAAAGDPGDAKDPAAEPPLPADVQTDELGNFLLKDVRVGTYTVTASAVVRGLKREKQADVTVAAPPARHRVDLDLR